MKNIFSYESKFFQLLVLISNLILLNLLFLMCCVPVVTIGAAQAGLMNAARVMQDKSDESSCFKAFFRGFSSGYTRITVIWLVLMIIVAIMLYILFSVIYYDAIWNNGPVICAIVGLAASMLLQSVATAFHSRFDCSIGQILRSAWYVMLMYPLRTLCMTVLVWGPIIIALVDLVLFLQITPVWLFIYYSTAFLFSARLMEKPFKQIEELVFPMAADESISDTVSSAKAEECK